jgi:hypothetical protein
MFWTLLERITNSDEVLATIAGLALTGLVALVLRIFAPKGKVHWSMYNEDHFILKDNEGKHFSVYTRTVWLRNAGREIVEGVEIVFNWHPPNVHVYPNLPYTIEGNEDERSVMRINTLNPGEFVFLAMLSSVRELPMLTNVRFRGGQGKQVKVAPQRIFSTPFNLAIFCLMVIGVVAVFYVLVRVMLYAFT